MMKVLLTLSLVANCILSWFLFNRKPEKEVIERVIVETHADFKPSQSEPQIPAVPTMEKTPVKVSDKKVELRPMGPHDPREVQDAGEKMETERTEFMTQELGLSEEKISEHNRLRNEYFKKTSQFWQKNPMRELTFKERRQLIDMEEDLYQKLEKLHGKQNWEKYQKFRETYNQRGFKKQMEENQPFLFMSI